MNKYICIIIIATLFAGKSYCQSYTDSLPVIKKTSVTTGKRSHYTQSSGSLIRANKEKGNSANATGNPLYKNNVGSNKKNTAVTGTYSVRQSHVYIPDSTGKKSSYKIIK